MLWIRATNSDIAHFRMTATKCGRSTEGVRPHLPPLEAIVPGEAGYVRCDSFVLGRVDVTETNGGAAAVPARYGRLARGAFLRSVQVCACDHWLSRVASTEST